LDGGWVEVRGSRLTAFGRGPAAGAIDLGDVAILPGFVKPISTSATPPNFFDLT
jgi:hypothetical protein